MQNKETNPFINEEYKKLYKNFLEKEIEKTAIRNKREEHKLKATVKAKALARAIQNYKKLEAEKSNAN